MLGPGIGGFEVVVIALVALIVVGPKDLPVMMRKVGQFMGRARKMASEFRASFDDMARASELDELRKEVEALRSGQMTTIGKETSDAFKAIDKDIRAPMPASTPASKAATVVPPMTEPSLDPATHDEIVASKLAAAEKAAPEPSEPTPAAKAARARKPKTQPTVATKARTARRKAADT